MSDDYFRELDRATFATVGITALGGLALVGALLGVWWLATLPRAPAAHVLVRDETAGAYRVCGYDKHDSEYVLTIPAADSCPATIVPRH